MRLRLSMLPLLVLSLTGLVPAPPVSADLRLPRVSQSASVTQTIGLTDLTVTYSRPGVKGRVIWGGLVPYEKPWRTGANEATTFTTTDSIRFGGRALAPGTYSLITIPGTAEWTVVLNAEKDLWGAFDYKPEKDVLRVTVHPTPAEAREWMEFAFEDLAPDAANLVLRWEKLRVAVPIVVDVNSHALTAIRAALATAKPDDWRTPRSASDFALSNQVALDEGRTWMRSALAIQENYQTRSLEARWQMKDGHREEAIRSAQKALALARASKESVETGPTEKLLAEWTAKKP